MTFNQVVGGSNPPCLMRPYSARNRDFFIILGNCFANPYIIKKALRFGCALARDEIDAKASALGARMSQAIFFIIRGYGGIGRRAGFRFQWATVQVQVLLSAVSLQLSVAENVTDSFFYCNRGNIVRYKYIAR